MKVHTDTAALPVFKKAVITIGTFDGVHLGHRQIIGQLKKEAARIGGETVLVTFDPHPRKIVDTRPLQLINTLPEKTALLEAQGIDHLVVVPFTPAFSSQPAEAYVEDFLVGRFHPHTVIIGYDHRFGKGRGGDFKLLEKYAASDTFELIEIPGQLIDDVTISSTRIREALLQGRLDEARGFLGYDFFFTGGVMEGNKLGRTIGYPTANLHIADSDKLVPGNGVYAVQVHGPGLTAPFMKGMMNIGIRPTVDGTKRVIEVNIFDFSGDIYGQNLLVTIKKYLRPEQKFNGLDALKEQLAKDKAASLEALSTGY
jgi:riboflavin kinase / FMN adenylyltransferase